MKLHRFRTMTESLSTSHSDLMNLRAKGKKLHRRTQSHTTFSLGEVVNKKNTSDEFIHEMLQNHNILNGDFTQKVLDAVNKGEDEKEVIIDDIDDIPNTGIIIPQGFSNNFNNPLNNLQKRNLLLMRNTFQATNSQFKKIDMLSQVKNIDDITGLNTIHEKRNSMESIETENLNKRSLNVTNSGSSSQNISKNASRAHSKHPSLDFRVGHSNNSSVDFRPIHSKKSSADMWSMHSKQSSVDIKPTHSKQSSADFRTLPKDMMNIGIRVEKEIDVIKYNLQSPKTVKAGENIPNTPSSEYLDKRNRFITELQKCSLDRLKKGNTTDHIPGKSSFKTDEPKQKPKLAHTNTLELKDKTKNANGNNPGAHQASSKHRRTYSGNVGKAGELISPRDDLASSAIFFNGKNPKEVVLSEYGSLANVEVQAEMTNALKKHKTVLVDDSMKKLTSKTDLLEGQIKNIFCIIESFANEKATLENVRSAELSCI